MDKIAARLRPRSKWEAADLGFALVRVWWWPMLMAWLMVFLPVALLIAGIAFGPALMTLGEAQEELIVAELLTPGLLATLALWWLKPLFERAPLYVLGEAMFGQVPTFKKIAKALPKLYWNNGIFASLTWRRLNPGRTFDFPIRQLEGSKGKFAAQRRRALNPYGWSVTATSAWVLIHAETVLPLAVAWLINMFWIGEGIFSLGFDLEASGAKLGEQVGLYLIYMLVLTFLEIYYVAVGFAMYLNARNALEGWDIELAFKRLRSRVETASRQRTARVQKHAAPAPASTRGTSGAKTVAALLLLSWPYLTPFGYFGYGANSYAAEKNSDSKAPAKPVDESAEIRKMAAQARAEATCAAKDMVLKRGWTPPDTPPVIVSADGAKDAVECVAAGEDDVKTSDSGTDDTLEKPEIRASSGIEKDGADAINGQARDARQLAVDELAADKRMGSTRENTRLKYAGPTWKESEKKKEPKADLKWLKAIAEFIAASLQYIGWAALAVLIIYLLYRALKNRGWLALQGARAPLPETLFGLDVRPESLPDDVPAAARALLARGDVRAALALIYRATLVFLLQDGRVEIANGDTEGDCMRRVRAGYTDKPSFNAMVRALFNAWLWVAYKGAPLAVAECEQLIATWQAEMRAARLTAIGGDAANANANAEVQRG